MKPDLAAQHADALLRLEHTRMQWVLRTARGSERSGGAAHPDDLAGSGPLNALLSEWFASELEARLWPTTADAQAQADSPALPSQLLSQTLSEWTGRHPWLGVLAGLLAGSLAVSQRQRLLQWGISAALPWLASNAAVLALPLLAQWLTQRPTPAASLEDPDTPAPEPAPSPSPEGEAAPDGDVNASRSGASISPG